MASPIQRELADLHDQSPVRTSSFPALEADDMAASLAEMLEALRREQDATEAEANRVTEELAEQKALNRAQAERIAALEAELGGAASAGGDPAAARLVDAELAAIALKCEELNELNQRLVAEHNAQVEALQGEVAALRSAAADPVAAPRQPAATAPTPAPEPAPAPSRPPAERAALPAASASPYTSEFAYSPGPELYVPPTAEGAENVLAMVAAQGERLAKAADDSLRTMRERLATAEHNCKTAELELQYALEQSAKAEQAAVLRPPSPRRVLRGLILCAVFHRSSRRLSPPRRRARLSSMRSSIPSCGSRWASCRSSSRRSPRASPPPRRRTLSASGTSTGWRRPG